MQSDRVIVWAESEAEIEDYISLVGDYAEFGIEQAYIAKRSRGMRDVGSMYTEGKYYPFNIELNATLDSTITAPQFVTDLVQWCSPDIILSTEKEALVSVETTYHELTYNNIAQRIPRQIRGACLGVPSVIFQKVDYSSKPLINWFVETFLKATRVYDTPCLAILFDEKDFADAKDLLVHLVNSSVVHKKEFQSTVDSIIKRMEQIGKDYDERTVLFEKRGIKKRKWIKVDNDSVTVSIGVRDNCALTGIPGYGCQGDDASKAAFREQLRYRGIGEKGCVWLSKGTGGMDPYPGLVKMAEILFCYDQNGKRTKRLISRFSCLPEDFWWFEKFPNEIYYKLVKEFSDEVQYADGYY